MVIEVLSGKLFLLVTGGSRGIGRQIAESFGAVLEPSSHILLLAKNEEALHEAASKISSKNVTCDYASVDLGAATKDQLEAAILKSLNGRGPDTFDRMVVVHNVGTIGDIKKSTNEMQDLDEWRSYYDLNVFLPAVLNGVLMKIFENTPNKVVINITSLWGSQPDKTVGYYCTGKAAREMFFRVFALENPDVNVLNYSPGPVATDMFDSVCTDSSDQELRKRFKEMRGTRTVLTAEQTTNRLLAVLIKQKYKSGDRVDYFDE